MTKYLTPGGISRFQEEKKVLRGALARLNGMSEPVRGVESMMDWTASFSSDSDVMKSMIRDRERVLSEAMPASPPRQCEHIDFGHMVRVSFGEKEMAFVLGAEGEPQGYRYNGQPVDTFYILADFGSEFKGVEKGDVIETRYKGKQVSMTIIEIIIPTDEHLLCNGGISSPQKAAA